MIGRATAAMVSAPSGAPRAIVLMGVAGSGKTTIGRQLAAALGWTFRDADDFHPPGNIAKMAAGIPLADADRVPWLRALHSALAASLARDDRLIVACSALRHRYRVILLEGLPDVRLVHLRGDYETILGRLQQRQGHFMKPAMLESQFATLEVPEDALAVDVAAAPETIVAHIRSALSL